MDAAAFDAVLRSLTVESSRRGVLRGLVVIVAAVAPSLPAVARAKRRLGRNEFGCVNAGRHCRGKNGVCCSGICRGRKPKKGKKDRSRCVAQDERGCRAGQQIVPCGGTTATLCTTSSGASGVCGTTTGSAGFCVQGFVCSSCTSDDQCQPSPDPKAACIRCATCPNGAACAVP
jgi:hypothetical protein